jgi:pyruvate kinase
VRRIAKEKDRTIGILQDLAGPKIRLGELCQGELLVQNGDTMVLRSGESSDDPEIVPVNYPYLAEDVEKGERILLADGLVEILVKDIEEELVYCEVVVGGKLSSHKGINLPSSNLRVPSFTEKDKKDLKLGLELGVEFVALSFVRHEKDLVQVREILNQVDNPPLLIAKIEKPQAVDRLPQILAQVDGAMVARGDLAVEMRLEEVPLIQKRIIRLARREGKPVITATQMLRSMMDNPRPTRAEATDVANAVLDGTDAVMLSDETAVGSFPVESVAMLDRIAHYTESKMDDMDFEAQDTEVVPATEGSISRAACMLSRELRAAAIVAATTSGSSARLVSRFRPKTAVIAITTSEKVQRQLTLSWGVVPALAPHYDNTDQMFEQAKKEAVKWGLGKGGDRLVITAGVPVGVPGTTNLVKVMDLID